MRSAIVRFCGYRRTQIRRDTITRDWGQRGRVGRPAERRHPLDTNDSATATVCGEHGGHDTVLFTNTDLDQNDPLVGICVDDMGVDDLGVDVFRRLIAPSGFFRKFALNENHAFYLFIIIELRLVTIYGLSWIGDFVLAEPPVTVVRYTFEAHIGQRWLVNSRNVGVSVEKGRRYPLLSCSRGGASRTTPVRHRFARRHGYRSMRGLGHSALFSAALILSGLVAVVMLRAPGFDRGLDPIDGSVSITLRTGEHKTSFAIPRHHVQYADNLRGGDQDVLTIKTTIPIKYDDFQPKYRNTIQTAYGLDGVPAFEIETTPLLLSSRPNVSRMMRHAIETAATATGEVVHDLNKFVHSKNTITVTSNNLLLHREMYYYIPINSGQQQGLYFECHFDAFADLCRGTGNFNEHINYTFDFDRENLKNWKVISTNIEALLDLFHRRAAVSEPVLGLLDR